MPTDYKQLGSNLDAETARMLEKMIAMNGDPSKSSFIRKLIRQEYARHYSEPNELITVEDALEAGKAIEDAQKEQIEAEYEHPTSRADVL